MAIRKLLVRWMKRENDHSIQYPRSRDGHYIHGALFYKQRDEDGRLTVPSIAEQLEARGYDLTTLRFECSLKEQ